MSEYAYIKELRSWDGRLLFEIAYDIDWNPLLFNDAETGQIIEFDYSR